MALYSRSVPHQRLGTGSRLGSRRCNRDETVHKGAIGDGSPWCAVLCSALYVVWGMLLQAIPVCRFNRDRSVRALDLEPSACFPLGTEDHEAER